MSLADFIARLDACKSSLDADAIYSDAFYAISRGDITRGDWDRLGALIRERWPRNPRSPVDAGGPRCAHGWTGD
jgi:hypothetical protein